MEWTTPAAMRGLLGLLSSQRDQVLEVILDWPRDGNLEAILRNPERRGLPHLRNHQRRGPDLAYGIMLRLEDPEEAFRLRPYRGGRSRISRSPHGTRSTRAAGAVSSSASRGRCRLRGGEPAVAARLSCDLSTLSRLWPAPWASEKPSSSAWWNSIRRRRAGCSTDFWMCPWPWIVERF